MSQGVELTIATKDVQHHDHSITLIPYQDSNSTWHPSPPNNKHHYATEPAHDTTAITPNPPSNSTNSPPPTFHPFRHLPPELRAQIWNHTIRLPRLIELRSTSSPSAHPLSLTLTSPPPLIDPHSTTWQSLTNPHPTLSTTHESRLHALTHFHLSLPLSHPFHPTTRTLLINPQTDILYPNTTHDLQIHALLSLIPLLTSSTSPSPNPSTSSPHTLQTLALNLARFTFYPRQILSTPYFPHLHRLYLVIEAECSDEPYQCLADPWLAEIKFGVPETEMEVRCWEGWSWGALGSLRAGGFVGGVENGDRDGDETGDGRRGLQVYFPAVRRARGYMGSGTQVDLDGLRLYGPCRENVWSD